MVSEEKVKKGPATLDLGTKKSAGSPLSTTVSTGKEVPEKTITVQEAAKQNEELRANLEVELRDRWEKEQDEKFATKANESTTKATANSEEIAEAVQKQQEKLEAENNMPTKLVIIRATSVAKDEARVGQLLPNIKRGFTVFKNGFGIYETGFSYDELKSFKQLPVWDKEKEIPNEDFWCKYNLVLTTKDKLIYPDKSEKHRIDYELAKGHPDIANSESEVTSLTPFHIVDEEAEAEKANIELDSLTQAYIYIQKMSPSERRAFLSLFGVGTKDVSDNIIVLHLRRQAEDSAQKFVKMYEDDNKRDKIIINEMVEYNVLQKRQGAFWFNESLLGTDFTTTVHWMSKPENQDIKLKLMQQLEIYKRR